MAIIQIEVPDGSHCTGCPCSLILPYEYSKAVKKFWSYGCTLLHVMCKSGGEYDTHAIKHPKCPSLNPRLIITESTKIAGKKGSPRGGLMRAMKLSPERRSEIAKKAAKARWNRLQITGNISRGYDK